MRGCKVLTRKEAKAMVKAAVNNRDALLIKTGLNFGTRVSESLALTFGDVKGTHVEIISKKKSENQTFPIPQDFKKLVKKVKADYIKAGFQVTDDTPLFIGRQSRSGGKIKAISRQMVSVIITKLKEILGFSGKVNSHSLRKTFVTEIYRLCKFDLVETAKYSRHKNLNNLIYYISTTQENNLVNDLAW